MWNEGDWIAAIAAVSLAAVLAFGARRERTQAEEVVGHPKGLFVLFFAEMWERFSYYGMRALLILYLTKHWLFDDGKANLIYGAYTSLVYITPVLGGYLADRYLGQRKAVLFGGVLLAIGHCLMAVEGESGAVRADPTINVFWLALSLHHRRLGLPQGQHLGDRRPALPADRHPPRRRLHHLLHGRERRRRARHDPRRLSRRDGRLGVTASASPASAWSLGLIIFVIGKPALRGRGEAPDAARLSRRLGGIKLEWLLYVRRPCRGGGDLGAGPVSGRRSGSC